MSKDERKETVERIAEKFASLQDNEKSERFEQESKEQRAAEQEMKLFQQGLANMLSYDGNASKRGAED